MGGTMMFDSIYDSSIENFSSAIPEPVEWETSLSEYCPIPGFYGEIPLRSTSFFVTAFIAFLCCVILSICLRRVWIQIRRLESWWSQNFRNPKSARFEAPVSFRHTGTAVSKARSTWSVIPFDIQLRILALLPYETVHRLKVVSKRQRKILEGRHFRELRSSENTLTALYFYIRDGVHHLAAYDPVLGQWRRLPPLDYLPKYCAPDPDLFKEYLVSSDKGIGVMNVSKGSEEKLIVFNFLTKKCRVLPELQYRRNPVLMHLIVDVDSSSFQVVVAGSSKPGDEDLSRVTEVFDSKTWTWRRTDDLPGSDYALNDYQSGVLMDGHIYIVAFLDQDAGRGILRYSLSKGEWLRDSTFPIPFAYASTILQLLENHGELFLFSEQETGDGGGLVHCVDKVESSVGEYGHEVWRLRNLVRNRKLGGRSLEIYPEFVCAGFSKHEVCIFNAIKHSGVVYDVRGFGESKVLPAPTGAGFCGNGFFSLNPLTFRIQPSFTMEI